MDAILLPILIIVAIFIIMRSNSRGKIDFRLKQLEEQAKLQAKEIERLKSQIQSAELQSSYQLSDKPAEDIKLPETQTVSVPGNTDISVAENSMESTEYKEELIPIETRQETPINDDSFSHDLSKPSEQNQVLYRLLKGNPILKVGAVILFLGLSFLLRFASEHISFSINTRYAGVAITGVICSIIGWRLRKTRREYGLTLQGLGIAVLYLTSLAAFKLHQLLPVWSVFLFQVILVVIMALLALMQNARLLAQVALIGGLASPALLSDGSGNHLILFSYLALLNTGVAVLAWFRSWRSLNLIGLVGSTILVGSWGAQYYQPEHYFTCQLFLAYYLALYTFIVWRFAILQSAKSNTFPPQDNNATLTQLFNYCLNGIKQIGILDSSLLIGSAISAFAMQYSMTHDLNNGVVYSCLGFGLFYGICGKFINCNTKLHTVSRAMYALSLIFFTLGIGNFFSEQQKNMALWGLEAALIYAFGIYQKAPIARLSAIVFFIPLSLFDALFGIVMLSNSFLIIALGLAISMAWQYYRSPVSALWEKFGVGTILAISLLALAFKPSILHQQEYIDKFSAIMLIVALAVGCTLIQRYLFNRLLTVGATIILFIAIFTFGIYSLPLNTETLVAILLGSASWFIGWSSANPKHHNNSFSGVTSLFGLIDLIIGCCLLFFALSNAELFETKLSTALNIVMLFAFISLFAKISKWQQVNTIQLTYLPIFALTSFSFYFHPEHLITQTSINEWLIILLFACALHYLILWQQRNDSSALYEKIKTNWHFIGLNVFILNFSISCVKWTQFMALTNAWLMLSFALIPLIALGMLITWRKYLTQCKLEDIYLQQGILPTLIFLTAWLIFGNIISDGTAAPLPYLPILNPLELASLITIYLFWRWQELYLPSKYQNLIPATLTAICLFIVSVIVMRVWHHYAEIEWKLTTLSVSFGLQATLSVIWTICAIILMLKGNKSAQQSVWFGGAALISLVVIKLFLVELSNSGGVARIVSFIVVGLLLLVVGYFAPLPPKNKVSQN